MASLFITLEGPEGSGKSTQAQLLAKHLLSAGYKVKLTREPGGDPVGEQIRRILLDGADHSVTQRTELLLYLAARAQHVDRVILPHLDEGFIMICDRFTDSTVAYQGYGGGLDIDLIRRMNAFATGNLSPDLTLLLDIDVETGLRRQPDHNRMERKGLEYHQRVREGFLREAELFPQRIMVVDAAEDIQAIHRRIVRRVAEMLGLIV